MSASARMYRCESLEAALARGAEIHPRLVVVVPPATELDVLHGGRPAHRVRLDVVELDEGARRAAASVLSDEGAAAEVAEPDRAFDLGGHVAGAGLGVAGPAGLQDG